MRSHTTLRFEPLEDRTLLTLLGVASLQQDPEISYDSGGYLWYNSSSQTFDYQNPTPQAITFFQSQSPNWSSTVIGVSATPTFQIHVLINNNGTLEGSGDTGNDLLVTSTVQLANGTIVGQDYNSNPQPLLTGTVTQFGFKQATPYDLFDFRFSVTGGALASLYVGQDIGVTADLDPGTGIAFAGNFNSNFDGHVKGTLGAIPKQSQPVTPAITTSQTPATATVGTSISDTATLSGGDSPTGTVTFNLYNNPNGTGPALFTDTESLSGGVATSASYATLAAGTDYWVATYNGDSNNISVSSGDTAEPVSITPATPSVDTTIVNVNTDGSTSPLTQPAALGTSVEDTASFDNLVSGFTPTGTVTYTFTGSELSGLTPPPTDWTEVNPTEWTDTVNVNTDGSVPNSAPVGALPAGNDYAFSAQYSGDSNYAGSTSPTGSEPLTISTGSTSIATALSGINGGALGTSSVYDTATITFTPRTTFTKGGTVTYTFSGSELSGLTPPPTDWTEVNPTEWTDTVNVNTDGSVPNSAPVGALPAGNDYAFNAQYSGDSNYAGSTSLAGSEPLTISKGNSSVSTTIFDSTTRTTPPSGALGESVYDTATVTGTPFTPTGNVTYTFTGSELAGLSVAAGWTKITSTEWQDTVIVNANGSVPNSATVGALPAGTDYAFGATYSGDGNYAGSVGGAEPLIIGQGNNQGLVNVSTTIYDSGGAAVTGALGEQVYDTATVTGGPFTPTGTVTYYFYDTSTPTYNQSATVGTPQVVTLNDDGTVPDSATTAALTAGSYAYIAVYSGDTNYAESVGAAEPLTINQGTLTLVTTIHDATTGGTPTGALGEKVYDTYTLSGAQPFAFTGTVNYTFQTGSGTPAAAGSGAQSTTEGPLQAGGYAFQVSSGGDSNYIINSSGPESLTINQGTLTLVTTIHDATTGGTPTGVLGESVYDTYTLSGAQPFAFTGTVSYTFNGSAAGSGAVHDRRPVAGGRLRFPGESGGDSNYIINSSGPEPLTINQGTLTLVTTIHDATTGGTPTGVLGESVYDTYTLSGAQPFAFTGTVSYTFNGSAAGSGAVHDRRAVAGGRLRFPGELGRGQQLHHQQQRPRVVDDQSGDADAGDHDPRRDHGRHADRRVGRVGIRHVHP